jgi:hypothetical protein
MLTHRCLEKNGKLSRDVSTVVPEHLGIKRQIGGADIPTYVRTMKRLRELPVQVVHAAAADFTLGDVSKNRCTAP